MRIDLSFISLLIYSSVALIEKYVPYALNNISNTVPYMKNLQTKLLSNRFTNF